MESAPIESLSIRNLCLTLILASGLLGWGFVAECLGESTSLLGFDDLQGGRNIPAITPSRGEQEAVGNKSGLPDWLTISANLEFSQRNTNFFESGYDASLFLADSRVEFWIPPWDTGLAWGPYLRGAGIVSNRDAAWENAWLAGPGVGFHVFPFSYPSLQNQGGLVATIFGPTRLFAEYNRLDYGGGENEWRPDEQVRMGADYWRAIYVNDTTKPLWAEIWSGLFWQSANEFDADYDTVLFANAIRAGIRKPNAGALSMLTPYVLVESSLTDNTEYYWENKLVAGAGIRLTPFIRNPTNNWLTRLVFFAEYLEIGDYYHAEAPSGIPDHDFRAGISLSIGEWYR